MKGKTHTAVLLHRVNAFIRGLILVVLTPAAFAVAPGNFDVFESGTIAGWQNNGPGPVVVPCVSTSGSKCLFNETMANPPGALKQVLFNEDQWVGNYFLQGINGVELWLRNAGLPTLEMRIGITDDPDGVGGDSGTCYVSQDSITLTANSSKRTVLGLKFDDLIRVDTGPLCGGSRSLKQVLSAVTHLRIFSAEMPQWTADDNLSKLEIDNIRALAQGQTQWRWLATKSQPAEDCPNINPMMAAGPWLHGHLLGDIDDPDSDADANSALPLLLRKYCLYRLAPGEGATPGMIRALTQHIGGGLKKAHPDVLAVGPPEHNSMRTDTPIQNQQNSGGGSFRMESSSVDDAIYDGLAENTRRLAGRPETEEPSHPFEQLDGNPQVRLSFLDTQPNNFNDSPSEPQQRSPHGIALMRLASWLTCDKGPLPDAMPIFTDCVAEVKGRIALSARCSDDIEMMNRSAECLDREEGGFTGLIGELARVVRDEIDEWQETSSDKRQVLNLSIGWEGFYGGAESDPNLMLTPVQAVYDTLRIANCYGAVVLAAAGNSVGGPVALDLPIYPAAWERKDGPSVGTCTTVLASADPLLIPNPDDFPAVGSGAYYPMVHAVGGTTATDQRLSNARAAAEPRLVAFSDHSVTPKWIESPMPGDESDKFGPLTGTSVGTAIVASTVAVAWHYRPELAGYDLMNQIHEASDSLDRSADFYLDSASVGPLVSRPRLCSVVKELCLDANCASELTCPEPGTSLTLRPTKIEDALMCDPSVDPLCEIVILPNTFQEAGADNDRCPDDILYTVTGMPWNESGRCPHRQYLNTTLRRGTDPQPEDAACPTCTMSAQSPGNLFLDLDIGFGRTIIDPATVGFATTLDLYFPTLVCDHHVYSLPASWFGAGLADDDAIPAGAQVNLIGVPETCTNAASMQLVFMVKGPMLVSDVGPYLDPFNQPFHTASAVFRVVDTDNDGVLNDVDNCTEEPNTDQRDTNGDGFGNACDGDTNNDCVVNFLDFSTFPPAFGSVDGDQNYDPDLDINGDGLINFLDLGIYPTQFGGPPGASANECLAVG